MGVSSRQGAREKGRQVVRGLIRLLGDDEAMLRNNLDFIGFDGKGAEIAVEDGSIRSVRVRGRDGELIEVVLVLTP